MPTASPASPPGTRTATDPAVWVERYGDYLFRFALIRVRNPGVAEDLVQETLLAALQSRQRFQGRSSERSWLTGILKHKIIDHFRRAAREQPTEDVETWSGEPQEPFDEAGHWRLAGGQGPAAWTAADTLQQQEFFAVLQGCLGKLPQRAAAAFTLREVEQQGTEEICQVLNITPTNLWVMLHRARLQLRRCLEANWFERKAS